MERRSFLAVLGATALTGCASLPEEQTASAEVVSQAAYRHNGPPALTLFTMINNNSGAGAHTSLMINASQRVVFDPAGSVRHRTIVERNDVLYGITPQLADFYARAHARRTYHVIIQRREVPAAVAEQAFQLAQQIGPVPQAQCALSTSRLLSQLPGFESIKVGWFPKKLADQFGALPGTNTQKLFEDDADDKSVALRMLDG